MRRKKRNLSLLLLGVLCFGLCLSGGLHADSSKAEATLSEVDLAETYTIGQTVTIPDATLTVDGTPRETTKTLVYPNGEAVAVDSAVMRMSGEHQIVYKTMVNGKLYEETKTFWC